MADSPLNRVEFYHKNRGMITALRAAAIPRAGEFVSINGETWKVDRVTWAVDVGLPWGEDLRANVELLPQD